jgi:hypothetical protein
MMRRIALALALSSALACSKEDVAATKQKIEQSAAAVQDVGREGIASAKEGIAEVKEEVQELVAPEPELSDAKLIDAAKKSIRCKQEQCTMPRDLFDQMLDRNELMSGQARTYKVEKAGQTVGVELQKLGPIPKALGFRSGDVLTDANGVPLDSLQSLAKVYVELKTSDTIAIGYRRGKKQRTKTITFNSAS